MSLKFGQIKVMKLKKYYLKIRNHKKLKFTKIFALFI